jgi:hypothetical protein
VGLTYGEVMRSSFGVGLVLMIAGMGLLAMQGLSYASEYWSAMSTVKPVAGGILFALGLSLMLAARQDAD